MKPRYIRGVSKTRPPVQTSPPEESAPAPIFYNWQELNLLTPAQVQEIAESWGIRNYWNVARDKLIDLILTKQDNYLAKDY